jgi:hypothetical protein
MSLQLSTQAYTTGYPVAAFNGENAQGGGGDISGVLVHYEQAGRERV